jgi:hypothetical protein
LPSPFRDRSGEQFVNCRRGPEAIWRFHTDAPQRFVIYSTIHCGTHFLRSALAAPPDVTVGDEVFTRGLPPWLGLKASRLDCEGQMWDDPESYVGETVVPIHRFYLVRTPSL